LPVDGSPSSVSQERIDEYTIALAAVYAVVDQQAQGLMVQV